MASVDSTSVSRPSPFSHLRTSAKGGDPADMGCPGRNATRKPSLIPSLNPLIQTKSLCLLFLSQVGGPPGIHVWQRLAHPRGKRTTNHKVIRAPSWTQSSAPLPALSWTLLLPASHHNTRRGFFPAMRRRPKRQGTSNAHTNSFPTRGLDTDKVSKRGEDRARVWFRFFCVRLQVEGGPAKADPPGVPGVVPLRLRHGGTTLPSVSLGGG